jgi:uncharacterized membrane protein
VNSIERDLRESGNDVAMSEPLVWITWVHVLSAFLLFGTGLGTAFHMWMAHVSGDVRAIAVVTRNVVLADWLFTTVAGIVQPISGLALVFQKGWSPFESWLIVTYVLYVVTGACWVPVVVIQMRVRDLAERAANRGAALPDEYFQMMQRWFQLGMPAFASMLVIVFLMIAKPRLW